MYGSITLRDGALLNKALDNDLGWGWHIVEVEPDVGGIGVEGP